VSNIPFEQRWWVSISEAQQATGIGRTRLFEAIAKNKIVSKKVGSRRLLSVRSLVAMYGPDTKVI
jgi:hypothetical protein